MFWEELERDGSSEASVSGKKAYRSCADAYRPKASFLRRRDPCCARERTFLRAEEAGKSVDEAWEVVPMRCLGRADGCLAWRTTPPRSLQLCDQPHKVLCYTTLATGKTLFATCLPCQRVDDDGKVVSEFLHEKNLDAQWVLEQQHVTDCLNMLHFKAMDISTSVAACSQVAYPRAKCLLTILLLFIHREWSPADYGETTTSML